MKKLLIILVLILCTVSYGRGGRQVKTKRQAKNESRYSGWMVQYENQLRTRRSYDNRRAPSTGRGYFADKQQREIDRLKRENAKLRAQVKSYKNMVARLQRGR